LLIFDMRGARQTTVGQGVSQYIKHLHTSAICVVDAMLGAVMGLKETWCTRGGNPA
jgi:hypothetical protein